METQISPLVCAFPCKKAPWAFGARPEKDGLLRDASKRAATLSVLPNAPALSGGRLMREEGYFPGGTTGRFLGEVPFKTASKRLVPDNVRSPGKRRFYKFEFKIVRMDRHEFFSPVFGLQRQSSRKTSPAEIFRRAGFSVMRGGCPPSQRHEGSLRRAGPAGPVTGENTPAGGGAALPE